MKDNGESRTRRRLRTRSHRVACFRCRPPCRDSGGVASGNQPDARCLQPDSRSATRWRSHLAAFLWHRHGDQLRATVSAARAGRVLAFVLIGLGLLELVAGVTMGGLWLVFIGWFVLTAARAEGADAVTRRNLGGLHVADVMSRQPLVAPGSMTLSEVINSSVLGSRHSTYPVTGIDGEVSGIVTLAQIRRIRQADRGGTLVAQIAISLSEVLVAAPGDPLVPLLDQLDQEGGDRALVFDDGSLVGIVTRRDLTRAAELGNETNQERRLVP